ncbi:MAG: putative Ig domain-containing protein, partial [Proteobacteria bacterium]|nr:putative Ig domain-containing protein [Pseudomonadota bacterium]
VYTITATNSIASSSATVTITINDPPPVVIAPALENIAAPVTTFAGTAISPAIIYTNTGGDATSCTVDTSGSKPDLPSGLSVATVTVGGKVTCQITGTPGNIASAVTYTITATNTAGPSSATVMITVVTAPALTNITAPVMAIVGAGVSPAIAFTNTGGDVTTCATSSSLPLGMSVGTTTEPSSGKVTCQITGIPNTVTATATYTITATNMAGMSSATIMITVTAPPPVVIAPVLANITTPVIAVTGTAINPAIVFTNTGGGATTCSVTAGNPALPAGLMSTTVTDAGIVTCQIIGTPNTATATSTYTITATNSGGPSSAMVTITVITAPALTNIAAPVTAIAGTPLSPAIVFTNTGS